MSVIYCAIGVIGLFLLLIITVCLLDIEKEIKEQTKYLKGINDDDDADVFNDEKVLA